MKPDRATNHVLPVDSPAYMRELMDKIGLSQYDVADRAGISRRRIQYLLVGTRIFLDARQDVALTYPEQYILESLSRVTKKAI